MNLHLFNRIVRQVLILPIFMLVLVAVALFWQVQSSSRRVSRIQESGEAIAQANLIGRYIVDEETGVRGYQATGDRQFLEPCGAAMTALPNAFVKLAALPLNVSEKETLKQLRTDYETFLESFVRPVIAMEQGQGENPTQIRDVALNLIGKQMMDKIRLDLQAVVDAAEEHRVTRVSRWQIQIQRMVGGLIALFLVVGLLIGLFTRNRLRKVSKTYQAALDSLRQRTEDIFLSEQQLRTTLASIGDGVITCTSDGHIRMMNQVACELTGWNAEEALDRPLQNVFHILNETTREPVEDPVSKVKRLNKVVGLANHTVLIRKDGKELDINDSGAPIRDQSGAITGIVLVFRDVTMEKRTQRALITNEKLAVAGRLAASIAHEIHNPLDSVSNILFLMKSGNSAEESEQFLSMAQQEIARVTKISRSMLSLYRESVAPVSIDIKEIVEGTLVLLEHRTHDLGSAINVAIPKGLCIEGFPAELRQVFTNLVVNAVEAAGSGGHVEINAQHISPGIDASGNRQEDGVLVEVVDNGPGIPESTLPSLFEPFFSTKGEQGTGLGLWVSRGIIRKHGGTIELASRPDNQGAIARVFLATHPVISPGAD